jgi:hypothetical protein
MLQRQGGNFPLTADANFGAAFGLVSSYFTSHATNPANSGTIRLASADPGVGFRNNANSGNLILTTDASDNLLYNGHILAGSTTGPVTSITGTANQVIASSPTGNITLSLPQNIATNSTPTFLALTLSGPTSLVLGTASTNIGSAVLYNSTNANYVQLTVGTTATSYLLKLPVNPGLSGQVLSTDGTGVTSWINASGGGTIISSPQYQLAYYATAGTTLSGDSSITTNANNQLLGVNGTAVNPTYAFSSGTDMGMYRVGANNVGFSVGGTQTLGLTGALFTSFIPLAMSANNITGVADPVNPQDAATKNYVDALGTTVSNVGSSVTYVTSLTPVNITSISLTTGTWMISGIVFANANGSTWSDVACGISTVSASFSGVLSGDNGAENSWANSSTTPLLATLSVPSWIHIVSGSATIYLVSYAVFSAGNPVAQKGRLTAVKIVH